MLDHSNYGFWHRQQGYQDPSKAEFVRAQSFWKTLWGDHIKVGKLLELAGVDLDRDYNMDGYTARQSGTVIEIEAKYNNLYHFASSFGYQPVEYTYEVNERAMPYVSRDMLVEDQPDDYPTSRKYTVQHGILVVFKVSGTFGFFNVVYLILMLSVSAALVGSATKIIDMFSIYAHPRRRNYFHLKYQVSPDFSDMWICEVCGYYNEKHREVCNGVDRWKSHDDDPGPCNAPRRRR